MLFIIGCSCVCVGVAEKLLEDPEIAPQRRKNKPPIFYLALGFACCAIPLIWDKLF